MESKRQKRQDYIDPGDKWKSIKQNNDNTGQDRNEDWTPTIPKSGADDEISQGREASDTQTEVELDHYLDLVKDLKMKLEAYRTVTENALVFYTSHQVEIQRVDTTRQQLNDMTTMCSDYRTTITSLQRHERDKEQELAKESAAIEMDRTNLDVMKEEVDRHNQQLAEEKIEFIDMMRRKEAEQLSSLQEEKAKFESEYQKQYAKRVEDLGKATKKIQDDDRQRMLNLQNKNEELAQNLEEQGRKLKDAEKRCKDIEKLKSLSESEVEDLSQRLEIAENEFGLSANSTEYLHVPKYSNPYEASLILYSGSEFLKIQNDVRTISLRYVEQMKINVVLQFSNHNSMLVSFC
jgi:chromosome segregation ATPase